MNAIINSSVSSNYEPPESSGGEGNIRPSGAAIPFAAVAVAFANFYLVFNASVATNGVVAANAVGGYNFNMTTFTNASTNANYITNVNWK